MLIYCQLDHAKQFWEILNQNTINVNGANVLENVVCETSGIIQAPVSLRKTRNSMKVHNALVHHVFGRSQRNFVHVTTRQLRCHDVCKISLWSVEHSFNQSTPNFDRIWPFSRVTRSRVIHAFNAYSVQIMSIVLLDKYHPFVMWSRVFGCFHY